MKMEFTLGYTSWILVHVSDGRNKFLVCDPTSAVGGMDLDIREYVPCLIVCGQSWVDVM